jgi:hypothetical protein
VHLLVLPKFLIRFNAWNKKCKSLINCTENFVANFDENLFQTKAKSRSGSCWRPVCCSVIRSVLSGFGRPPWRQCSSVHSCTPVTYIYIFTYVVILIKVMFIFSKYSFLFSSNCRHLPSTVKRPKLEAGNSQTTSAHVKNMWSLPLLPPHVFKDVHKENCRSPFFDNFLSSYSLEDRFPGLLDRGYYKYEI